MVQFDEAEEEYHFVSAQVQQYFSNNARVVLKIAMTKHG